MSGSFKTLSELFQARSEDPTHGLVFVQGQDDQRRVSYAAHFDAALRLLGLLQARGARAGQAVILHIGDNQRFLEGFWACVLGGLVPVPVAGGISDEHRRKLFRIHARLDATRPDASQLNSTWVYTEPAAFERLGKYAVTQGLQGQLTELGERAVIVDATCLSELQAHAPGSIHAADAADTAFIQFSSGSTSDPKGIVLTHENLLINLAAIRAGMQMIPDEVMLSWMPLTHDMGLIGFHLTPVFGAIDHVLMPTDLFVRRPALWLTVAAEHRASVLCSPNFGYEHLLKSFNADRHADLDLSSIRLIFNGAEPISATLADRFMQTLAPFGLRQDAMIMVYGLAEASLAVSFPEVHAPYARVRVARGPMGVGDRVRIVSRAAGPQPLNGRESEADDDAPLTFVGEGTPVNDCELRLLDQQGTVVPETTIGRVLIRGGNVTAGYFREPELNAELISADGWLDTGDLGFVLDGQLYLTGRAKDLMFLNGQNVYPHDLENLAIEAGLAEAGKIALAASSKASSNARARADAGHEQVLCFVQHRGDMARLAERAGAIRRVINETAGVRIHRIIPVQRLPKTTSGKVQRFLLAQGYGQGEYDTALAELDVALAEQGLTPQSAYDARPEVVPEGPAASAPAGSPAAGESLDESMARGGESNSQAAGQGTSDAAASPGVLGTLHGICQAQIDEITVGLDDNLFDIGISSLTLAQIHEEIDRTWPDAVDITDLFDYPSIRALAGLLEERTGA